MKALHNTRSLRPSTMTGPSRRRLKAPGALALAGSIALLLVSPSAPAATKTFDGNNTGATALDVALNWNADGVPAGADEVLLDGAGLPSQLTTAGSLTFGDLIWNTSANGTITLNRSDTTSQTLTLGGTLATNTAAPAAGGVVGDLFVMGSAATSNTLTIGGNTGGGSGVLNLAINRAGNFDIVNAGATLYLNAALGGGSALTKTGLGTLVLAGANTFGDTAVTFTINAGTVVLTGNGTLGSKFGDVAVNAKLDLGGTSQTIDSLTSSVTTSTIYNNGSVGMSTLTIGNDFGGGTFSGVISNNTDFGSGTVALTKIGTGTTTLGNTNTYSGPTTVNLSYVGNSLGGGGLTLSTSAGQVTNSALTLNGTTLTTSSTTVGTATRAASLTLNNATVAIAGNATNNSIDAISGSMFFSSGRSTFTLTPSSAKNALFTAGSLARTPGATVLFRGGNLGTATLASATINTGNISFGNAPTLSGSGAVSTTTVGILPWAYGDNSSAGIGTDFLTYDPSIGLRRLTSSEYVTTFASGNAAENNAKITTPIGGINTATTLNSLLLGTAGRVNGSGTLNIVSGGVLAVDNSSIGTIVPGALNFGGNEAILNAVAGKTLTVGSTITGSGGLTAGGAGTVALTGSNSFTGGTYLSGGALNITSDAALGATGGNLTFSGGTLQAGSAGVVLDAGRSIVSSVAVLNAIFDTNGNAMTIPGAIGGSGGINKINAGTLTLSGVNNYSGPTYASGGVLNLTSSLPNTSGLILTGGEAKLDFNAATAPSANIVNSNTPLTFNNGAQNIAGVNTLTIQGKNNADSFQFFTGTTFGNFASHLNLAPGAGTGTLTVSLGPISRTSLALNSSNKTNPVGATLDVTLPASGVTISTTGTLTGTAGTGGAPGSGILVGVTVNGNTWATINNGNLVGTTAYVTSYASTTNGINFDATTSGTLTTDLNTLRFNTPAPTTVTLNAGITPRALLAGGILVTPAVGANLSKISGGILQGIGRRDIILIQNNTLGDLQIDASITDASGVSGQGITKSGLGKVILTGINGQSGSTVINEGTLVVTGDTIAQTITNGTVATGALTTISGLASTANLFVGQRVIQATAAPATNTSTTWVITSIIDSTSVTISNAAAATVSAGSFTFAAGGALGSATTAPSIAPGATLQIGNNTTTGTLTAGQGIANNGSVIFNRSNAYTYGTNSGEIINGTGSVTQAGQNTLTLSGTNTYTGATNVLNGATLIANNVSAFGVNSAVNVATGGTLQFNGRAMSLGSLQGGGVVENASATNVTLTLGGDNTSKTFSGNLRNGTGGGILTITKVGTGTQTLSGTNTSTGVLSVNAGAVNIAGGFTGQIQVGGAGTNGILNIQDGANINAVVTGLFGSILPGYVAGAAGAVYQSGGAVTFNAQIAFGGAGSSGFYGLSGGTITDSPLTNVGNERFRVGGVFANSSGVFYQSGGSVNLLSGGPQLEIAANTGGGVVGSTGIGYFTGGTFTSVQGLRIGSDGNTGTLRGEMTVAGTASLNFASNAILGSSATDVGILNLNNGGTLAVRMLQKGTSGIGRVNFNGGILKAATSATAATFFTGLTSATVYSGGATIDTNSQSITVAQPLIAPTSNGVSTVAVTNAGFGYAGAPVVTITGGGGTGATAVANMVDDGTGNGTFKIASITITNPGTDYTSAPAMAVTGGGGANAVIGTPALAANVSGGFTKTGAGILTLSGSSTYTGPTSVTGGTLQLSGAISAGSALNVSNGTMALLNATTPISTTTALTLGGPGTTGMLQLGAGLDNIAESFGTLTLSGNAVLDFGAGTGGQDLLFSGISRASGTTLSILGWSGNAYTAGTTATDRLLFTTGSSSAFTSLFPNQSDVSFNGTAGYSVIDFGGGNGYEIVAVPEPTTTALVGILGLLGLARSRRRGSRPQAS